MSYMNYMNNKHTWFIHACIKKEGRLVNKFKNGEYRDGMKTIGDMIGMMCGAYLRVNLCITLLL